VTATFGLWRRVVDEVLYPEEVLEFLRQMGYDPKARRGFECLSTSFHWSDEGLPRATRLCMGHGSRATFYTMVFRTSLIKGEPIEEYRRNWEQLRSACPEWPGLRSERSRPELLPAWQRALKRMCIDFERDVRESGRSAGPEAEPSGAPDAGRSNG
jgi:hypothetical protein